jgi:hypothetical protein
VIHVFVLPKPQEKRGWPGQADEAIQSFDAAQRDWIASLRSQQRLDLFHVKQPCLRSIKTRVVSRETNHGL